jgi:hypothetical protein
MAKAKKKAAAKKAKTSVAISGTIPKLTLSMALDAKKIAAIQRCVEKGTLRLTVSKVDLARGRIGESWIYD